MFVYDSNSDGGTEKGYIYKMAERKIEGILDGLENGVIRLHGYTTVEPIMADFITSPPRALTGKEFIDAINDFFNKINTLNTLEGIRLPLKNTIWLTVGNVT